MKTVAEKMGIKKDMRSILVNAPDNIIEVLDLPGVDLKRRLSGEFDYIHLFVSSQQQFHNKYPKLIKYLKGSGMLWLSWPKSKQTATDLNIKTVIKLGYDYGLVESKAISVDDTWSALKFTRPKTGKTYNNSYGKLKEL